MVKTRVIKNFWILTLFLVGCDIVGEDLKYIEPILLLERELKSTYSRDICFCDDQIVYFDDYKKELFSIDLNGRVLWSRGTSRATRFECSNQKIFLFEKNSNNTITSDSVRSKITILDLENAEEVNVLDVTIPSISGVDAYSSGYGFMKVRIVKDLAFISTGDGLIKALDLQSNEVKWQVEINSHLASDFLISGLDLFALSHQGTVYSIKCSTGVVNWKADYGKFSIPKSLLDYESKLFFALQDGSFVVVSKSDGARLLLTNENLTGMSDISDSTLILSNDLNFKLISKNTHEIITEGKVNTNPFYSFVNGDFFVIRDDFRLDFYDRTDIKYLFSVEAGPYSGVHLDENTMIYPLKNKLIWSSLPPVSSFE